MAQSFNLAVLLGRLTKEPEMLANQSTNVMYTRNTLAVAREGQKEVTDFIDIIAFGNNAKFICDYLHKGNLVQVMGSIQVNTNEKDGVKRTFTSINVTKVVNVSTKEENKKSAMKSDDYVPSAYSAPEEYKPEEYEKLPF